MKSLTQLQQEARSVVDKICFDPEVRLNAKLVLDSLTARVYAAALDAVEAGIEAMKFDSPMGEEYVYNQAYDDAEEIVAAHLRTLREGITGNEKL